MFGPHDDNGLFLDGEFPIVLPDAAGAWEDMRARLDEQPVRRSFYWVCISGIIILALGFAWLRFPGERAVGRVGRGVPEAADLVPGAAGGMTGVTGSAHGAGMGTASWTAGTGTKTDGGEPAVVSADPVARADDSARTVAGIAVASDTAAKLPKQELPAQHAAAAGPVELQEEQPIVLLTGLEWATQVPTANASHYFTGTTGRDQFYRLLIPAVWMQVQSKGSLLEIAFAPSFSKLVAPRTFSEESNSNIVADSLVTMHTTKALDKLFGVALSMSYAVALRGSWWAGGGLRADWWKRGIATTSTIENKTSLINPVTNVSSSFSSTAPLSGADWSNFSRFQIDLSAQLLYRTTGQQAGLRISMPFTPLNKNGGAGDSFRAELFYRLAIFGGKIKLSLSKPGE
jgi:hypothetical protein